MYHMPQAEPGPVLKAVGDAKALEFRVAVGQLWTFNPHNPNAHYVLHMKSYFDR